MSVRRSPRNSHVVAAVAKQEASTITTQAKRSIKQDPDGKPLTAIKKTKIEVVKKEESQEPDTSLLHASSTKKPPANWNIVYDLLEALREKEKAPVDTMGCERLADSAATPIVQRFQTLVALMLSSQTKDTVTSVAVRKLQQELPGGLCLQDILEIDEAALDKMIATIGFHTKKASYLKRTAEILRDQYNGDIPDTIEGLTSLPGVGPKMGYLTLQVAWNKNLGIGVDVHVHRICNRLGWVKTKTPEETREDLQSWLPKDKWRKINPIMVGYGQIVCLPRGPRCDVCPVNQYCPSSELKKIVKKVKKVESVYFKKEEDH
ncbi:alpha,alpha-trehalase nth1 [Mucor circinelloides]